MAAQFESLLHPFVILLTVPLAVIGVVLSLLVTGLPMSSMAMIGLILLAGIVVNNAIVLIDRINQLRIEGRPRRACDPRGGRGAIAADPDDDAHHRDRFLADGPGRGRGPSSDARSPSLWSVACRWGRLLTLFVIPALYEALDRKHDAAFARLRVRPEPSA